MVVSLLMLLAIQTHPIARIDSLVQGGVSAGVYPGAVLLVGTADTVLMQRGYGHFTWSSESPVPTPDSTYFDLASLTKVAGTTSAIMMLVQSGTISLDDPVVRYVPDFAGEDRSAIVVRNLLEHRSGLRAFLPLNEQAATAEEARRLVVTEQLRWAPGGRVEYSDLNAMLLGWVVEGASGMTLDRYLAERVFPSIGLDQARFRLPRSLRNRAAPINSWRGQPIQGVIHDQNAERLGGVAGHAGLYATGSEMARLAQVWLRLGRNHAGESVFDSALVREFMARGRGNRALGWEKNDTTEVGSAGSKMSGEAFGHGGYTGTSVWIDPVNDVFVVLLTNRVFGPRTSRSIAKLREVRGAVADAAVDLRVHSCRMIAMADSTAPHCPR